MIDNFGKELKKIRFSSLALSFWGQTLSCGIGELNAFLRVPFKHPFLRSPILAPKWVGYDLNRPIFRPFVM